MKARTHELSMLEYAAVFFLFALVAAMFGFTGIAAGAALVAKLLFVFFSVVALGTVLVRVLRDSSTPQ